MDIRDGQQRRSLCIGVNWVILDVLTLDWLKAINSGNQLLVEHIVASLCTLGGVIFKVRRLHLELFGFDIVEQLSQLNFIIASFNLLIIEILDKDGEHLCRTSKVLIRVHSTVILAKHLSHPLLVVNQLGVKILRRQFRFL